MGLPHRYGGLWGCPIDGGPHDPHIWGDYVLFLGGGLCNVALFSPPPLPHRYGAVGLPYRWGGSPRPHIGGDYVLCFGGGLFITLLSSLPIDMEGLWGCPIDIGVWGCPIDMGGCPIDGGVPTTPILGVIMCCVLGGVSL